MLARGFSGYTTRDALAILDQAVPAEHPHSVVLFFGASDSVLPDQFHHVPLEAYGTNIQTLATQIACSGAWVLLITPPPLDERKTCSRTMAHTEQYALACYETALEMNLPVIDLFHLIQQHTDWERTCMLDGIHLNTAGMDVLYEATVTELNKQMPLTELPRLGIGDA